MFINCTTLFINCTFLEYLRIKSVRYCLPGFLSFLDYCTCISLLSYNVFYFFIELHQELLFSSCKIRGSSVFHFPIGESVFDPVVYLRMP